jgi:hypothetical protein
MLDQMTQDREGLASQTDLFDAPPQPLVLRIEPKRRKIAQLGSRGSHLNTQLFEQLLGLYEVKGVEALGEPAINFDEH